MKELCEIGDKTFFTAAILVTRHPRRLVLSGCLAALIVMTILSVLVGWAAPDLVDDLKKQRQPFLTQFFLPISLKGFSTIFFEEWHDKSQVALPGGILFSVRNPILPFNS